MKTSILVLAVVVLTACDKSDSTTATTATTTTATATAIATTTATAAAATDVNDPTDEEVRADTQDLTAQNADGELKKLEQEVASHY